MAEKNELSIPDRLMDFRAIPLGEITGKSVSFIMERMTELQLRSPTLPIKLVINSPGGSYHAAVGLSDFMDHMITAPIHGLVFGGCHSGATVVLLSCDKRVCSPHSSFIIHNATTSGIEVKHDKLTEKTILDLSLEIKQITASMISIYAQKLGISKKKAMQLLERGDQTYNQALSAEEALEIGLVHEIVKGKLDVFTRPSA
jgi:ATP-dependent Clp protease, protease subunit